MATCGCTAAGKSPWARAWAAAWLNAGPVTHSAAEAADVNLIFTFSMMVAYRWKTPYFGRKCMQVVMVICTLCHGLLSIVSWLLTSWQSIRGYILETISYWHQGCHLIHFCSKYIWYSLRCCDNMVLHSCVLLHVLCFFLSFYLLFFYFGCNCNFSCFFTVLPSWCNNKWMN